MREMKESSVSFEKDNNAPHEVPGPKLSESRTLYKEMKMKSYAGDDQNNPIEQPAMHELHHGEHAAPLKGLKSMEIVSSHPVGRQAHPDSMPNLHKPGSFKDQSKGGRNPKGMGRSEAKKAINAEKRSVENY